MLIIDRSTWLARRCAAGEAAYDAEADSCHEYPNAAQHEWVYGCS
jgi:hypothetical protein